MGLQVRPGDLNADEPAVIDLLIRCVNPHYDKARFDWLYRANPAGQGRLWVATDSAGTLIGTAAAFPRSLYRRGRAIVGWVLADFCVAESYRALGPALTLQRACLQDLTASPGSLWYDFPATGMMAIYRRLGCEPVTRITRLVKPLRVDEQVAAVLPSRGMARAVASIGNRFLRRGLRPAREAQDLHTRIHEGPCDREFTDLSEKVAPTYGLCLSRSAAYLNWRFRENPLQACEIVATRRRGELLAYAVMVQDGSTAHLLDVFGVPDHRVIREVLSAALLLLHDRGCQTVSCARLESPPWGWSLKRLGFIARESTPVMLHMTQDNESSPPLQIKDDSWFLTWGDRDA